MSIEPGPQTLTIHLSGCDSKDRLLGLIHRRLDPAPVEPKKRRHRRMPNALVPVDEGMVLDQREPERRRLRRQAWIQIIASECLPWLRDCGLQGSEVTKHGLLAGLFHDQPVKEEHLSEAEVAHYFRRS